MTRVKNPVLPGFHPDPSILRVGGDYYIATSTFQWFPGVEIYHSKDLANWEFVTRPLSEKRLLDMTGVPDSGGVWAPCLTYADGLFYLVYSNVKTYRNYYKDVDNYVITSPSLEGPWSDPVYLNSSGFDASMFHDTDGRKYLVNMVWDQRDKRNAFWGIVLQEYDPLRKSLIGKPKCIFRGSEIGKTEGPHIYKINGYYYLVCAEGGTFYEHAVTVARSENLWGEYELSPKHPLLTSNGHPELVIQKSGHGSLVETPDGKWYVAHLCGRPNGNKGRCMLGRETSIQNLVLRDDGWFDLDNATGMPEEYFEVSGSVEVLPKAKERISTFPGKLPDEFQTLRIPLSEEYMHFNREKEHLILAGKDSMESLHQQSLVGRRREDFQFIAETKLYFDPVNFQQLAGMALYYDTSNYFYLYVSFDEEKGRYISLMECNKGSFIERSEKIKLSVTGSDDGVTLRMAVMNDRAEFSYSAGDSGIVRIGVPLDATQLSDDYYDEDREGLRFTGTFITLSCQDVSGQKREAEFAYFRYLAIDK